MKLVEEFFLIKFLPNTTITIKKDNQGSIALIQNLIFYIYINHTNLLQYYT